MLVLGSTSMISSFIAHVQAIYRSRIAFKLFSSIGMYGYLFCMQVNAVLGNVLPLRTGDNA